MYLARVRIEDRLHFIIRESRPDPEKGGYTSRDLLDLGDDPAVHLRYAGSHGFYVAPAVLDRLGEKGVTPAADELEELFWPFVAPEARRAMEPFRGRGKTFAPLTEAERQAIRRLHPFDKRRLHFLRFGSIDQGPLHRLPPRLFRKLLHQSRDQLEQYFLEAESLLRPAEFKSYVYTIFDLRKYFGGDLVRRMPQAIDQAALDDRFFAELCKLQDDPAFRAGASAEERPPEYLSRYVIMFFDYEFGPGSVLDDYLRDFMNSRRQFRPPPAGPVSPGEAAAIFEEKPEVLAALSPRELTRLYRKRAHQLHPDKGGEQEAFVRLTEAYHALLQRKGKASR